MSEDKSKPKPTAPNPDTEGRAGPEAGSNGDGGPPLDPRLFLALAVTAGLLLLLSILFWDPAADFFYQYYSGPVISDARDETVEGVNEGYNVYNTLTYGLLFLLGGLAIHQLLGWLKIALDEKLIIAAIPLVVLGGLARTLEDTQFFAEPVSYLFIAPIIYFTLAIGAVAALLVGALLRRFYRQGSPRGSAMVALAFLAFLVVLHLVVWSQGSELTAHLLNPLVVILLLVAIAGGGYYAFGTRLLEEPVLVLGLAGLTGVGLALLYMAAFARDPWTPGAGTQPAILYRTAGVWTLAMALTLGGLTALGRLQPQLKTHLAPYLAPLTLALFAAHYLDGSATFVGIEYYGYAEKHVLPDFLIRTFGTAAVMLPLKGLVVFFVIYLLDVTYKKQLDDNRELIMLTKLLVLTLGLAPGVRDIARIALGV